MRDRGSAPLLLVFAMLAIATVPAVLVHRAVMREFSLEGEALMGTRAGLAADSSLAWVLSAGWTPDPPDGEGGRRDSVVSVPGSVLPGEGAIHEDGEIQARFLGPWPGDPGLEAWKLTVRGRVRVMAGGRPVRTFLQVREAWVTTAKAAPGASPVLRAWRIAR